MLNKEDTWAQSSSFDSAVKKVSYSHWHSCKTPHSASMISKHQAPQKGHSRLKTCWVNGVPFLCDSQYPPCWSVLEEEGMPKKKTYEEKKWEKSWWRSLFSTFPPQFTKELPEESRHPHQCQQLTSSNIFFITLRQPDLMPDSIFNQTSVPTLSRPAFLLCEEVHLSYKLFSLHNHIQPPLQEIMFIVFLFVPNN